MKTAEFEREALLLKEILNECETKEDVLLFYTKCLIKMHKAYFKIVNTEMLSYVKQIMEPAFPLVIQYFSDEVRDCLKETDVQRKEKLLTDIEESIVEFGEMFEAIVNSTNGADRILLQTAPVDIGLRYTAPKLCAYYSSMLNEFAELMKDENQGQYAFCVYPTLKSGAEAYIMFHESRRHGKVCIIRMPENRIGHIAYVRQVLFHELFHILPSQVRNRKDRADRLNRILPIGLWPYLLEGENPSIFMKKRCPGDSEKDIFLSEDEVVNLQDLLISKLPVQCNPNFENEDESSHKLYSIPVKQFFVDTIVGFLAKFHAKGLDDFLPCFNSGDIRRNYKQYCEMESKVKEVQGRVLKNSLRLIHNERVVDICNFYMLLFREPLSDLLSVLVLQSTPCDFYRHLLTKTDGLPLPEEVDNNLHLLYLRAAFVTEILWDDSVFCSLTERQRQLIEIWKSADSYQECVSEPALKEFVHHMICFLSQQERTFFQNIDPEFARELPQQKGQSGESGKITMPLTPYIHEEYIKYFRDCCSRFLLFEGAHETEFADFRTRYQLNSSNDLALAKYISLRSWE